MNRPDSRPLPRKAQLGEETDMDRTGLIAKTLTGALIGASLWGISGCGGGASTVPVSATGG